MDTMKTPLSFFNPSQPLEVVNISLSQTWFDLIETANSKIIVFKQLPNLTPNKNYIVKLQVDNVVKVSYVATLRTDNFSNIFAIFNNAYSLFEPIDTKSWLAQKRLTELINYITTTDTITEIKDNYPLAVFTIIDEINNQTTIWKEELNVRPIT